MSKKNVSSVDLAAIVQELQFLARSKLSHIYHQEQKELLLQFHTSKHGKQHIKIIVGKYLCLTSKTQTVVHPTSFCMQLRKYIDNATVVSITQKDAERIVIFEFEKKEKFFLIVELFSKGNIILTDDQWQVLGTLEQQLWKDRLVRAKQEYVFPTAQTSWKTVAVSELGVILAKSEKRNLATALATELGLGGVYAEELCKRAGIAKEMLPVDATEKQIRFLIEQRDVLIKELTKPHGFRYSDDIAPMELFEKEVLEKTETYSELIDQIIPFVKTSPYEQKIKSLEKIISEQLESIRKQEEAIALNTAKGEVLYQHYTALQKLLEIVKELRKTKSWTDVGSELKKEKKIKSVDLKKKTIVIDL
ncbi:NFACT family protein [Candidatus Woesearchaeota archaeon]|nr:NFACT family protein [Candidatus Woesearchaeota archaeon]